MAIALRNRAGTTLTDASYRTGFGELIDNTRTVFANYVVKVLPMPPYGPDVYGAIGSWAGAAVIAVVVALWLIRMGSSRVRTTGLLTFVCTLAPSLLTRAAVSVMNFPTFRQLYLPLAGVGLLLCAWRPAGFRRMGSWVAGGVVLALVVLYKTMGPALARTDDRGAHERAGARLDALLGGAEPQVAVAQIRASACGYSPDFDARGREVWKLIPATSGGGVPDQRPGRGTTTACPHGTAAAHGGMAAPRDCDGSHARAAGRCGHRVPADVRPSARRLCFRHRLWLRRSRALAARRAGGELTLQQSGDHQDTKKGPRWPSGPE